MDALAILYISTLVHRHYITKADSQICPHDFVHANLWLIASVIGQHYAYCILPLLALQIFWINKLSETSRKTAHSCLHPLYENIMCVSLLCGGMWHASGDCRWWWPANLDKHCVTTKQLQLLHCFHIESNHRVVIIYSFVHNQTIWSFLPLQDCCWEIFLCCWLPVTPKIRKNLIKNHQSEGLQWPNNKKHSHNMLTTKKCL